MDLSELKGKGPVADGQVLTNGYGLPRSAMGSVAVEVFGPELGSNPVKVPGSFTFS